MKCFETKMTYPHFLKYLIPSVLTMIFLSFYTTIDGFFVSNMPVRMRWRESTS